MATSQAQDIFRLGSPQGITAINRDAQGRLTDWVENGFTVTVQRDSAGRTVGLSAQPFRGSAPAIRQGFIYNAAGQLQTTTGTKIDTQLAGELFSSNGGLPITASPSGTLSDSRLQALVSGAGNSDVSLRSILSVGGDHPYRQWWGNDGKDGMAAMFKAVGIKPYIAICADEQTADVTSGYGATLGKPGMLTAEQAQSLQDEGAEFVSHATRHQHFWELLNTGIRVWYTGAEAAPTVNVSTTQLTTSTATTGATAFTWATYPTLNELRTAIKALPGWNCEIATELLGTELSSTLMPLNAARTVATTLGGADPMNNNQRFAISGGIMLRYSGSAYRDIAISVNDGSNFFSIFADGARIAAISTITTLTAVVAAINALNIAGMTALVMDNGFKATTVAGSSTLNPGQLIRESYCYGDELASGLHRIPQAQSINFTGIQCSGGIGFAYAFRRAIVAAKERAESIYGLTLDSFAQPGGRLWPWHVRSALGEHVQWRGNRSFTESNSGLSPHAMPVNAVGRFVGHFTSIVASSTGTPYSEDDVKAVLDALADSGGWYVNWLNHLCTPTPGDPSPFTGMNQQSVGTYTSSADQDEGSFWRELQHAAALRDAKAFDILPPTAAERVRDTRKAPSNRVFNPRFRNGRANNLRGINSVVQGNGGIACPGWNLATPTTDYTAVTVDPVSGELTLTTNGALGANRTPIGSNLFLEPGKTYDIGASLNLLAWGAANNVRFVLYPLQGGMGEDLSIAASNLNSQPFFGGSHHDAMMRFTVPPRGRPAPAYIRGIAGPFAFTAGDAITVNIDNRGASAAIVLTGLTTAKAVAAAVNAALAADAIYGNLAQYHNAARAEDNRLILEAPVLNSSPGDSGSLAQISNSTGTPLAILFGAGVSVLRATGKAHDTLDSTVVGYRLSVLLGATSATKSIGITAPYCTEFQP